MQSVTQKNFPKLAAELCRQNRIGILVSGGCDSEVLLRAAVDVSGNTNTTAFTAVTPFVAPYYTDIIEAAACELNIRLLRVELNPIDKEDIAQNTSRRCYYCKKAIYSAVRALAQTEGVSILADGTNLDDITEYRPGLMAAEELDIRHPFLNAGMTKADIRELGRLLNMNDPERPSDSCLATRIPEGTPLTSETLELIGRIEKPLRPFVKGRLRAGISTDRITVFYQTIDRELINSHKNALKRTAVESNCSIEFLEMANS